MRTSLRGALARLTVFSLVCALGLFALLAVFAQLRFDRQVTYRAHFQNVSGLVPGNFVRIAGVEVGKVGQIALQKDNTAIVDFAVDPSVVLTEGTLVEVRWENLIGGRYLALTEGAGSTHTLRPQAFIPLQRTAAALDLDALIGGFRPLFRALNPDQVNALTGQLIAAFQDQGDSIETLLANTASFTSTLADRDKLIGDVIANLSTVLTSLADEREQFGSAVESLATLVHGLAERRSAVAASLAHANDSAVTVTDLLSQARKPLQDFVHQTDRASGLVVADHEYVDNLLATLPDAYRTLSRLGLYGDFFSFYLCDLLLKVNGKGGEPVFIKVAGQDTGRCTPKQ